jgi:circadian clock protein KaiC
MSAGDGGEVHSMILRLVDFLKTLGVTALFTNLGLGSAETTTTQMEVSSLMDTWLLLYNRESNGEHNRQLYVLKSRGMAHSNQIREFILSSEGIKLRAAYIGSEGVFTGSARLAQESKEKAAQLLRRQEQDRRSRELDRQRREIAAQIAILQAQLEENEILIRHEIEREDQLAADRNAMASSRRVTPSPKATAKFSNKSKPRAVQE